MADCPATGGPIEPRISAVLPVPMNSEQSSCAPTPLVATAMWLHDDQDGGPAATAALAPAETAQQLTQQPAQAFTLPLQPVAEVSAEHAAQCGLRIAQASILPVSCAHGYEYAVPVAVVRGAVSQSKVREGGTRTKKTYT